jgi:hypothetical protein
MPISRPGDAGGSEADGRREQGKPGQTSELHHVLPPKDSFLVKESKVRTRVSVSLSP